LKAIDQKCVLGSHWITARNIPGTGFPALASGLRFVHSVCSGGVAHALPEAVQAASLLAAARSATDAKSPPWRRYKKHPPAAGAKHHPPGENRMADREQEHGGIVARWLSAGLPTLIPRGFGEADRTRLYHQTGRSMYMRQALISETQYHQHQAVTSDWAESRRFCGFRWARRSFRSRSPRIASAPAVSCRRAGRIQ